MAKTAHLTLPIITRYEGKEYEIATLTVPYSAVLGTNDEGKASVTVGIEEGKPLAIALADAIYEQYGKE